MVPEKLSTSVREYEYMLFFRSLCVLHIHIVLELLLPRAATPKQSIVV